MITTPELITELGPNEIFVFGSNYAGRHGAGAAKCALKFGAKMGVGKGLRGQTYGIPTKDGRLHVLSLPEIEVSVERFIHFADCNPALRFLVTPIGCGLAGYKPADIAPMFSGVYGNVILPSCFAKLLYETS